MKGLDIELAHFVMADRLKPDQPYGCALYSRSIP
jgi:hypothetical protein